MEFYNLSEIVGAFKKVCTCFVQYCAITCLLTCFLITLLARSSEMKKGRKEQLNHNQQCVHFGAAETNKQSFVIEARKN